MDERKTHGLGILWQPSLPIVVSTGGFKKHGKRISDWDVTATMHHALPERGVLWNYQPKKMLVLFTRGFEVIQVKPKYIWVMWYPHLSFFKSQKTLEKKTTHPQSPRPRSRTAYTPSFHMIQIGRRGRAPIYDILRDQVLVENGMTKRQIWIMRANALRDGKPVDSVNGCTAYIWIACPRVLRGHVSDRQNFTWKMRCLANVIFFLEFTNIDCFTIYPVSIISFPLQNECRNTC